MDHEGSVCPEPLSSHGLCYAAIVFSHVADVVSLGIHYYVAIGLLEAKEDIHHLDLPLNHDARLLEK